ncbi:MAG: 2-C-methyl-D-erythritol 2,4-cyclodiphosphate synthase [Bacteroidales bacterium]|nr:2-C-methyl-D-erythritol 2,4-cyclodiphosphate synthase [Bacteroidales bacterium]
MSSFRIGFGSDLHRLEDSLPLVIGGVNIPHSKGCVGHSDGDALIHAICDALLGAANLRDIGYHFPDTSDDNKNKESKYFLTEVMKLIRNDSYDLGNIDCTINLQEPKLKNHIPSMKLFLAGIMQVEASQISIKAKTGEHIGPIGRQEAISVECVALISKV